jgi:hypothetical protein
MQNVVKQRIVYFFQIGIGISLVIWILSQVQQDKFFDYFANISSLKLMIILSTSAAGLFIQFWRWRYLVEQYSMSYQLPDILPSFFAGFAFRLLIPGGHAEFSKIFMLPGKKSGKVLAFGMEKIFQTLIKVLALLIVIPMTFPDYQLICLVGILVLTGIYIFLPRLKIFTYMQEKSANYHRVFLMNLFFSVLVFLIMAGQYYILLNQVQHLSIGATLQSVVYLWSAGMVPISVSGLGVREGLAVYFLQQYGVLPAYAVATSLFLFTINTILPALIGVYYIYIKRSCFGEIKDSIKSTREIIRSLKNSKKM